MSNVRIADMEVGFFWGGIGGNSEAHEVYQQTVTFKNSLMAGRSINNARLGKSTGVLMPIFASVGYSISPTVCGPLGGKWTWGIYGMEHPTGSNPAIAGEVPSRATPSSASSRAPSSSRRTCAAGWSRPTRCRRTLSSSRPSTR